MFGRSRPEALERIVYCSRARIDTTSLQAIAEILGVSQRNNAREGLTGALAVNDGWFLQVVEGPGPAIDRLLRRVAARVTPDIGPQLQRLIDECRVAPEAAVDALLRIVAGRKAAMETDAR